LLKWQAFSDHFFGQCFETLHQHGHTDVPTHTRHDPENNNSNDYVLGLGAKHGFREIVMRSPGRYELSLLHTPTSELPALDGILQHPLLANLVPALLGKSAMDDLKLCHLSLLVATPGSSEQAWHADGGHVSVTEHLSCHVLNVFIPLHDVPRTKGPTEIRPGTHYHTRNLAPMMLAAKCRKSLQNPVCSPLKLGDVLVFDYRVLHRGKANRSKENRTILVLTFSQPWFEDVVNFPKQSMMDPPVASISPSASALSLQP
jgi:hypothetical protein